MTNTPTARFEHLLSTRARIGWGGPAAAARPAGPPPSLAFSAFVEPGDPIICEGPTFSGSLNNIRRHGPEILDVPVDAEGMVTSAGRARLGGPRRQGGRGEVLLPTAHVQH